MKHAGLYHPLQSRYRELLFSRQIKKNRKDYLEYKGRGFSCNVCGEHYEKFVPFYPENENEKPLRDNAVIAGYGENIFCPNCMSTARERLIIGIIKDEYALTGKKILHLSPEKNIYNLIRKEAEVVTADMEPGFYKKIHMDIQQEDITRLSFDNHSFDMVIGNHIMEHIPSDKQAMRELFRVLKPGGLAILQIPFSGKNTSTIETPSINDPKQQSKLYGQKDHVRIYVLKDYVERLRSAGFKIAIRPYSQLQQYYIHAIQEGECFLEICKPSSFE